MQVCIIYLYEFSSGLSVGIKNSKSVTLNDLDRRNDRRRALSLRRSSFLIFLSVVQHSTSTRQSLQCMQHPRETNRDINGCCISNTCVAHRKLSHQQQWDAGRTRTVPSQSSYTQQWWTQTQQAMYTRI